LALTTTVDEEDERMAGLFAPLARSVAQLDDPVFVGVLWRSLVWAALAFVILLGGAIFAVHSLLLFHGWWGWAADLLSTVGVALLAFWLYLPIAVVIGALFMERIAAAVERRFYPLLPAPRGAPLAMQIWDGLAVGARVLVLNLVALVVALVIPGIGFVLAWAIAGFAIGRGLFVAVAMRRMSRGQAEVAYRRRRLAVLAQGGAIALAGYVPLLNLLIPVLGVATMVHVLQDSRTV
jgi:CysZ protein